jgi:hypothetical protein
MPTFKKYYAFFWSLLWVLWIVLAVQPDSRGIVKLGLIVVFGFQLVGSMYLFWNKQPIRVFIFVFTAFLLFGLALPGRTVDSANLRESYIETLERYEGSNYYWGGENQFGIDCSGLVRRGFVRANMTQGIQTFNGSLIRDACSIWWFDSSAKAMRDEYRGKTVFLFEAASINALDHSRLEPGDIAVTATGVHSLVYIGDSVWMHAAPDRGKAQYETVPVADSGWFDMPVRILRWHSLMDSGE